MGMIKVTKSWELHHSSEFWDEIVDWCVRQFGDGRSRWQSQATIHYMDFMFEREEDAALFIMKWM